MTSANGEGEGLMSYSAATRRDVIQRVSLGVWGAGASAIFVYSLFLSNRTRLSLSDGALKWLQEL